MARKYKRRTSEARVFETKLRNPAYLPEGGAAKTRRGYFRVVLDDAPRMRSMHHAHQNNAVLTSNRIHNMLSYQKQKHALSPNRPKTAPRPETVLLLGTMARSCPMHPLYFPSSAVISQSQRFEPDSNTHSAQPSYPATQRPRCHPDAYDTPHILSRR